MTKQPHQRHSSEVRLDDAEIGGATVIAGRVRIAAFLFEDEGEAGEEAGREISHRCSQTLRSRIRQRKRESPCR